MVIFEKNKGAEQLKNTLINKTTFYPQIKSKTYFKINNKHS